MPVETIQLPLSPLEKLQIALVQRSRRPVGIFYAPAIHRALRELAHTEDLQAVGPLAEVLSLWEQPYPQTASLLFRLLPRFRSGDSDLLNERQRACLHRALQRSKSHLRFWSYDPTFTVILEHVLTTIGELPAQDEQADDSLTPPQALAATRLLQPFQAAVRHRRHTTVLTTAVGALTAACGIAFPLVLWCSSVPLPLVASLFTVLISGLLLTAQFSYQGHWRLKSLMAPLETTSDLRIAGPLLEIAAAEEGSPRTMALRILTHLLPRFRASGTPMLTDTQYTALLRTLARAGAPPDYYLAVLKALEQIGDLRALPVVERLARGHHSALYAKQVQGAAQDCLPYLRLLCDNQRAGQTLLRASDGVETSSDTLLRPARASLSTEATELLRADVTLSDKS